MEKRIRVRGTDMYKKAVIPCSLVRKGEYNKMLNAYEKGIETTVYAYASDEVITTWAEDRKTRADVDKKNYYFPLETDIKKEDILNGYVVQTVNVIYELPNAIRKGVARYLIVQVYHSEL